MKKSPTKREMFALSKKAETALYNCWKVLDTQDPMFKVVFKLTSNFITKVYWHYKPTKMSTNE